MDNKTKIRLLKTIKENNYIKRFKEIFNLNINLSDILLINEIDANKIINSSFSDSVGLIKLYEIITGKKIDDNIENELFYSTDEVLKYSINIINSNIIDNKEDYIKVLNKGKEKSIKYAYYLTTKEEIVNHLYGLSIINVVSKSDENISMYLRDIFSMEDILNNSSFNELFQLIISCKNIEKMKYIYKLCNLNLITSPDFIENIKLIINANSSEELKIIYKQILNIPIVDSTPENTCELLEKYINENNIDKVLYIISYESEKVKKI